MNKQFFIVLSLLAMSNVFYAADKYRKPISTSDDAGIEIRNVCGDMIIGSKDSPRENKHGKFEVQVFGGRNEPKFVRREDYDNDCWSFGLGKLSDDEPDTMEIVEWRSEAIQRCKVQSGDRNFSLSGPFDSEDYKKANELIFEVIFSELIREKLTQRKKSAQSVVPAPKNSSLGTMNDLD